MTKETDEEILRQRREIEKLCEEARENAFYCADLLHENKRLEARIEDLEKMIAVHRLAVDVDALKARIAELEAVLRPFADAYDAELDDGPQDDLDSYDVAWRDLRAARAALEKKNDGPD